MNDELPDGWHRAPLDSLCERLRGVSYARDEASPNPKPGFVPILRANNIENDQLRFDDLVYVPKTRVSDAQHIRRGDVVIAMSSGSKSVVGKTAQAMEKWDGAFGAFCGVLRPSSELDSRYVGLFLRTRDYRRRISDLAAGTNINNLKAEHFSEIEVPLAPLAEQQRIVAKLEKLLDQVVTCQERLSRIPILLKRFRQAVLAAACSGRLTVDWRENHEVQKTAGETLRGLNLEEKFKLADDYEMTPLPDTWEYVPIGNISGFQQGMQIAKATRLKQDGRNRLPILGSYRRSSIGEHLEKSLPTQWLRNKSTQAITSKRHSI